MDEWEFPSPPQKSVKRRPLITSPAPKKVQKTKFKHKKTMIPVIPVAPDCTGLNAMMLALEKMGIADHVTEQFASDIQEDCRQILSVNFNGLIDGALKL